MEKFYYKSPIGILEIRFQNNKLISLKLTEKLGISCEETSFTKTVKLQLDEYFSGKREFFNLKINPEGTIFQKRVWEELQKIPYGETKSYSQIARLIRNKNAQRAVGSACNKNPIMIIIPCHRVISKNGKLGGFAYEIAAKQYMLNLESSNN